MWELDNKKCWALKNWCLWTMALEKTLEGPLDSKEIKSVNPKENQPWIVIGRTNTEAEAPMLWPPDMSCQFIGKSPDARKDWRQEAKGWQRMRWFDDITDLEFEKIWKTVKDREAWCASVHVVTESDMTWRLNNNNRCVLIFHCCLNGY